MKKFVLIFFCIATLGFAADAQTLKFGHVNTNELISLMTERDSALVKIQAYGADLDETMQGMYSEYETKLNEYNRKVNEWAPVVREAKEKDLQELGQRIQQFQQSAQQEMQQMQQTLMAPVVQKAQEALNKIAKANNLTYLIDLSAGSIVYFDPANSLDVLPLAKKELGIPAAKVAPTQIPAPNEGK